MARTASKKTKSRAKKVSPEVSAAIKLFKASEEVESFYTYIHENKLRSEAAILMSTILQTLKPQKKKRKVLQ
jgi:hypothetical protein